jgi:transcriptional regulator with XRE-family HTH domain
MFNKHVLCFDEMRPSPQKHTLAVLRLAIGLSQKELADLIKRSARTIQAIELGQMALSDELGQEICRQTAVSQKWLIANDVKKPILDKRGKPYTRHSYEHQQAWINRNLGDAPDDLWWTEANILGFIQAYCNLAGATLKEGRFPLFNYKATQAIFSLLKEFGENNFEFTEAFTGEDDIGPAAMRSLDKLLKAVRKKFKKNPN